MGARDGNILAENLLEAISECGGGIGGLYWTAARGQGKEAYGYEVPML